MITRKELVDKMNALLRDMLGSVTDDEFNQRMQEIRVDISDLKGGVRSDPGG